MPVITLHATGLLSFFLPHITEHSPGKGRLKMHFHLGKRHIIPVHDGSNSHYSHGYRYPNERGLVGTGRRLCQEKKKIQPSREYSVKLLSNQASSHAAGQWGQPFGMGQAAVRSRQKLTREARAHPVRLRFRDNTSLDEKDVATPGWLKQTNSLPSPLQLQSPPW